MKTIAIILILLFIPVMGNAADKWDNTDIGLAASALALRTMDWRQSREIAENPLIFREINPMLGDHPSTGQVDAYFAVSALAQIGIAHVLPSKWRKIWLSCWIGMSGATVYRNNAVGLGIKW